MTTPLEIRVRVMREVDTYLQFTGEDRWVYTGDLEAGKLWAAQHRFVHIDADEVGGQFYVYLSTDDPQVYWEDEAGEHCSDLSDAASEICNEVGGGKTEEQAWRIALGWMFGPDDDGYDHNWLRARLISMIDPFPTNSEEVETWLRR